jgi:hypothetical protein
MFHVKPQITANNGPPSAKSTFFAHLGRSFSNGHNAPGRRFIDASTFRPRSTMAKTRHGRAAASHSNPARMTAVKGFRAGAAAEAWRQRPLVRLLRQLERLEPRPAVSGPRTSPRNADHLASTR